MYLCHKIALIYFKPASWRAHTKHSKCSFELRWCPIAKLIICAVAINSFGLDFRLDTQQMKRSSFVVWRSHTQVPTSWCKCLFRLGSL